MPEPASPAPERLPAGANLEQLKNQAKELLAAVRGGDASALERAGTYVQGGDPATFALHDAQAALARSYGFPSWTKLKEHVDGATVTRLAEAARTGDVAAIRRIARARPELLNMDVPGFGEHKALHFAVLHRQPEAARALVRAGADPHSGIYPHRDATGALTLAREREYAEVVAAIEEEEQLHREALSCPNATVSPAQDRLNEAIARGDEATVRAMVEADGSLLKACDRAGANPLHTAASHLGPELVRWLAARHNAVRKADLSGRTPLDHAALAVTADTLERFREVAQELETRGARLTPRAAVALGDAARISSLFEADPYAFHQVDARKGGLIALAARLNRPDLVRLLLEMGLHPDETVRLPEYEEEMFSQGFALWHVAGEGQYEIAEMLLGAGADPGATVHASGDAMSRAYNSRDVRMQELLRRAGARPDPATLGLNGDLAAAREFLRELAQRAEQLSSRTGGLRTETEELLWGAACGGFPEIVALCLERIDWQPDDPRWFDLLIQPLRLWSHHPHRKFKDVDRAAYPACLQLMLDHGADPNVEGRFGRRVLHDVAATGTVWGQVIITEAERERFATILLDAGARLDPRDGLLLSTPLGWAARWGRRGLAEVLLRRGAPPEEPDAEPWATPGAWARKMGHTDLEALLAGQRQSG